jgi:hypothetical protein
MSDNVEKRFETDIHTYIHTTYIHNTNMLMVIRYMEVRQYNSYFKKNRIYSEQHVSALATVRFQFAQLMLSGRKMVWGPDDEISLSAKHKCQLRVILMVFSVICYSTNNNILTLIERLARTVIIGPSL